MMSVALGLCIAMITMALKGIWEWWEHRQYHKEMQERIYRKRIREHWFESDRDLW